MLMIDWIFIEEIHTKNTKRRRTQRRRV